MFFELLYLLAVLFYGVIEVPLDGAIFLCEPFLGGFSRFLREDRQFVNDLSDLINGRVRILCHLRWNLRLVGIVYAQGAMLRLPRAIPPTFQNNDTLTNSRFLL